MIGHSEAFSAYLPCRISLLEDREGKLWLYSLDMDMDMDMMIKGGQDLARRTARRCAESPGDHHRHHGQGRRRRLLTRDAPLAPGSGNRPLPEEGLRQFAALSPGRELLSFRGPETHHGRAFRSMLNVVPPVMILQVVEPATPGGLFICRCAPLRQFATSGKLCQHL